MSLQLGVEEEEEEEQRWRRKRAKIERMSNRKKLLAGKRALYKVRIAIKLNCFSQTMERERVRVSNNVIKTPAMPTAATLLAKEGGGDDGGDGACALPSSLKCRIKKGGRKTTAHGLHCAPVASLGLPWLFHVAVS